MELSVKEKSDIEGDTIYLKEQKSLYKDVSELLSDYSNREHPSTYWRSDDSLQCTEDRNRSFDDLLLLCKNYFPNTTVNEIVKFYVNESKSAKNEDKIAYCSYCSGVRKPVVHPKNAIKKNVKNVSAINDFFYFPSIRYDIKENSQFSPQELIDMVDDD